jgi:hypothetical protein
MVLPARGFLISHHASPEVNNSPSREIAESDAALVARIRRTAIEGAAPSSEICRVPSAVTLVKNGAGDLFGAAIAPNGRGLLFVNEGTNAVDLAIVR